MPRLIGGVVVDKGSDEDVDIARQRYAALCRTHLWTVAAELWQTYFCKSVRPRMCRMLQRAGGRVVCLDGVWWFGWGGARGWPCV